MSGETISKSYKKLSADEAALRDEKMMESLRSGVGYPNERPDASFQHHYPHESTAEQRTGGSPSKSSRTSVTGTVAPGSEYDNRLKEINLATASGGTITAYEWYNDPQALDMGYKQSHKENDLDWEKMDAHRRTMNGMAEEHRDGDADDEMESDPEEYLDRIESGKGTQGVRRAIYRLTASVLGECDIYQKDMILEHSMREIDGLGLSFR
ncbi:uncharacterized protein CC84DRAFT_1179178 [Paraphaeosphaeria sporulosa]|uniref:Uncharacterized protein n=1 Tax=Paraphaeosphaeria sporulosa TaxID=1460663 RepID=A0A177C6C2_9PLEO|nr:uncharacterized protein CC84DRAFT_1179178 [Paraphaeosphaeria sporulosa]OAG02240.1 hypothetical protein CC84DRAFT_1179178 [Paraphaeosphaeria sporulosa]